MWKLFFPVFVIYINLLLLSHLSKFFEAKNRNWSAQNLPSGHACNVITVQCWSLHAWCNFSLMWLRWPTPMLIYIVYFNQISNYTSNSRVKTTSKNSKPGYFFSNCFQFQITNASIHVTKIFLQYRFCMIPIIIN